MKLMCIIISIVLFSIIISGCANHKYDWTDLLVPPKGCVSEGYNSTYHTYSYKCEAPNNVSAEISMRLNYEKQNSLIKLESYSEYIANRTQYLIELNNSYGPDIYITGFELNYKKCTNQREYLNSEIVFFLNSTENYGKQAFSSWTYVLDNEVLTISYIVQGMLSPEVQPYPSKELAKQMGLIC